MPDGFNAEGALADESAMVALQHRARKSGEKHVDEIAKAARSARLSCQSVVQIAVPDEGVCVAARKRKCDAIFMGSHGQRGLKRLVLGSVTSRVPASADEPVIVYR
jgi:nucleotide-binding universal stress UspA family protein